MNEHMGLLYMHMYVLYICCAKMHVLTPRSAWDFFHTGAQGIYSIETSSQPCHLKLVLIPQTNHYLIRSYGLLNSWVTLKTRTVLLNTTVMTSCISFSVIWFSMYTLLRVFKVKSSQISFIAWKIRKIGEASADTAATEAHYMKGYYNLEEETIKVKI